MNFTKSLLTLSLSALWLISCKQTNSAPKTEGNAVASTETTVPAKLETASFNIEGMTCAMGCAKTIEKKLSGMEGVQKATVDFEKKTATVEFDANKQTPETLVKTVEATADGKTYKVSNVKSSGNHAMLFDQEKEKKAEKKAKVKKSDKTEAAAETTRGGAESSGAKPACCSGKKHCSADEKKA